VRAVERQIEITQFPQLEVVANGVVDAFAVNLADVARYELNEAELVRSPSMLPYR
jgi:hypothetical protein